MAFVKSPRGLFFRASQDGGRLTGATGAAGRTHH